MRATPIRAISAAAMVMALGVAACSDVTSGSSTASGLERAMDSVSGAGPARTWFSYGDLARLRTLGAYTGRSGTFHLNTRWSRVVGMGADQLAAVALALPDETGIEVYGYDTAVTIGQPPNTAVKFTGAVPEAEITTRLTALGAKPRTFGGTQGLSFRGDNKIDVDSPLTTRLHLINQLNQVVVTDKLLAASPNAATIRAALGDGPSLLDTDGYREVADCLGDVLAAAIFRPNTPQARTVAVGVRDAPSLTSTQHEVACVLPAAGKQGAVEAAMRSGLALTATDAASRTPLSRWFSAIAVTAQDKTVRAVLSVRSSAPPGYVFAALQREAYKSWLGD